MKISSLIFGVSILSKIISKHLIETKLVIENMVTLEKLIVQIAYRLQ